MSKLDKVKKVAMAKGFAVRENEPLKNYTSFKIGGKAEMMIIATDPQGLQDVLIVCDNEYIPVFVLGRGSNVLVADKGIDGVVIKLEGSFTNMSLVDNDEIFCGAGVSLAKLCNFAYENSLSGLEFAWGIPGSAGGAAYMNAGAYGGEMKDVLVSCTHIDNNQKQGTFIRDDLKLSYRHSVYGENNFIITGMLLKLTKDSPVEIRNRMDEYMAKRKEKQPLDYPSAGSVFKRPRDSYAGALIEQAGLKGKQIGDAAVSQKHCGFIVNKGNATCKDVLELVKYIQDTIEAKNGIRLECEIKPVGKL